MPDHQIVRPRQATPARRDAKRLLTTVAQSLARAFRRWQQRKAIAHLEALDNRQLEDIGISRNDIPRVVERLFRSKGESVPLRSPTARGESTNELRKAA